MGDETLRTVHVILPAYNEEAALPSLMGRLGEFATRERVSLLAWVVDDGSTDRTSDVARRGHPGLDVKLVIHTVNQGLGQAVHTGLREVNQVAAADDVIVVMDADDTHEVDLIHTMLAQIDEGADLVIASRYVPGGDDSTAPLYRRLLSRGAAYVFSAMMPVQVHDFTSGYRSYRADLIDRAIQHWGERIIEERGFACMVELLLKLRHCQPVIAEVPMVLRYDRKRGASKLKVIRTMVQYLKLAARDRLSPPPYRQL